MKYSILILTVFISALSFGQQAATPKADPVYRVVQVMPEFPGGKDSLNDYIAANLKYPRTAKVDRVEGTVTIEFTVEADGSLTEVKVKKSAEPRLDKEALRLVQSMPKFSPGKQGGKAVRVISTVSVPFKITEK